MEPEARRAIAAVAPAPPELVRAARSPSGGLPVLLDDLAILGAALYCCSGRELVRLRGEVSLSR
eukprot:scaffold648251_cov43-Prasinocladus_malaysianus.AAC.1